MNMRKELKLKESINLNRESMLSVIQTSSMLMRTAGRFFSKYVVTDVQFNILILLKGKERGLSQQELTDCLIATKSNVVGLIDRLEKSGLVKRQSDPKDRRLNKVILTREGRNIVKKIEGDYIAEVNRIMEPLSAEEKIAMVAATQKIRAYLHNHWSE